MCRVQTPMPPYKHRWSQKKPHTPSLLLQDPPLIGSWGQTPCKRLWHWSCCLMCTCTQFMIVPTPTGPGGLAREQVPDFRVKHPQGSGAKVAKHTDPTRAYPIGPHGTNPRTKTKHKYKARDTCFFCLSGCVCPWWVQRFHVKKFRAQERKIPHTDPTGPTDWAL